jgi:CTP:molybdopterin cytidylyltransferase MocA
VAGADPTMSPRGRVGLVLAAGSGTRYGGPKALVESRGETWVERAVRSLAEGGCDRVLVTVGARMDEVRSVLPADVRAVEVPDHLTGMGASLRAGLTAAAAAGALQAVITLVDLPDVGSAVVRRLLGSVRPDDTEVLARAAYDGRPGHPVLIGCGHFAGVQAEAAGDAGARTYLARHQALLVDCSDLATGRDVDHPPA